MPMDKKEDLLKQRDEAKKEAAQYENQVRGDKGQRKRNRRKADVSFLLAHMGFGEGTSPSRPQDATAPGRAHGTGHGV
mgnify:CR=1 FL=1